MSADADIVTEVIEDALVVPETALVFEGGDVLVERVVRASSPKLERRQVEVVNAPPLLLPERVVMVMGSLVGVGVAAGLLPALRAARVDAAVSLRGA